MLEQFTNRNFKINPLTKRELNSLDNRVVKIKNIIEITDEEDILDNLENELDEIISILKRSIKLATIRECSLRIVK